MKTIIKSINILVLLFILASCSKDDAPSVDTAITVASVSPTSGPKNTTVTINGNHFGEDPSKVQVYFNDKEAQIQSVENTKIITMVPAGAFTGDITIIVDGTTLSGPEFEYIISEHIVSTLAGSTIGSNDGVGSNAQFNRPTGVAIDYLGNTYVADPINNRIRKITPNGNVTTLAGGTQGNQDGTGTEAQFNLPWDVDVDAQGNVYVADTNNHRIRKITPEGVVTTLAGSTIGIEDGVGTEAKFDHPRGIAVSADGIVYVADTGNQQVRKIDATTNVTSFPAGFGTVTGIDIAPNGTVYAVSSSNHTIWKIDFEMTQIYTIAGNNGEGDVNSDANSSKFRYPKDIAIDGEGNIYIADEGNNKIKKISTDNLVTTYAGSTVGFNDGVGENAQFNLPYGIAITSEGQIYVADTVNHRVRKIIQE